MTFPFFLPQTYFDPKMLSTHLHFVEELNSTYGHDAE